MTLLILGLALFIAVHMVPWSPTLRGALVSGMGENVYKLLFTAIALGGVVVIVIGMGRAPFVPYWEPPVSLKHLTRLLVLVGFILLPAAHLPTNIKRYTRHPMLWGVVLWGVGHLLANGDLASIVLFGSFVVYSLAAMVSANARGAQKATVAYPVSRDLIVVAAGVVVYLVITFVHGYLFGYPLI